MIPRFAVGQRVRVVRVDDIPYGEKYSFLEATIDKTGVIREYDAGLYAVAMDEDGRLLSLTQSCLEEAG